MKTLTLYWLNNTDQLEEPALNLLSTQCISSHMPAVLVRESFAREQVSAKLVLDKNHQLIGIVGNRQLVEQNIQRIQSEHRVPREEVLVKDVMKPRNDILVMDYKDVQTASIRDVAQTLKAAGRLYCLVVDRHNHQIHGFFSLQDVDLDKDLLPNTDTAIQLVQFHNVVPT